MNWTKSSIHELDLFAVSNKHRKHSSVEDLLAPKLGSILGQAINRRY